MATGFPPSNTISPGVYIAEQDLSFIAPAETFHSAAVVGFASKGPMNIPTVVVSQQDLTTKFGYPHPDVGDPYLIYAAQQYLLVATQLYVVRVGDQDQVSWERAQTAAVNAPAAGGQVMITSSTAGPYSFDNDSFFRWSLNGILAAKTLVVLSDFNREAPLTGQAYSTAQLVADLNAQLSYDVDGIEFFATDADQIGVMTTFSFGPDATLELVSVQDAIYGGPTATDGGTNPTGLATGMTMASETGSNASYPTDGYFTSGVWNFTGLSNLTIELVVDGTDNVLIDNVVQVISLDALVEGNPEPTTLDIAVEINNQVLNGTVPGGFKAGATGDNLTISTLARGEDSQLLIKTDSTTFDIFGFQVMTAVGTTPEGSTDEVDITTLGIVHGSAGAGETSVTFMADSAGIDGNATQVVVANNIADGNFNVAVYNNNVQVESWGPLTKNQISSYYVETYLTEVSSWIRAVDVPSNPAPPANGTYTLTGGSDGIPANPDDQDALLIGNPVGYTGMYSLSDPEQIDIDIVACPGHSSTNIVMGLLDLCQNYRQDCMALIDPPFGLTVQEIVQWQNGAHPLNTTRFDSDFAALYWPWVKIHDNYNLVDVWVPPSGSIMAVYANSDNLAAPWFAPAGLNRGMVPGITDVFSRPTQADRDNMYGNANAVNPIVQFSDVDGFVVWGQKTLQRTPTALDRVNVRRLLFVLEKRIRSAARGLLFDPNDDTFQQSFTDLCTAILQEVQVGRGLYAFIIEDDSTLNTPAVIDRNEFHAKIGIQPTKAVEFIFIEFSVNPTGSFATQSSTTTQSTSNSF